jgi:hypothetical protein
MFIGVIRQGFIFSPMYSEYQLTCLKIWPQKLGSAES